jgi:CRISPR-associated RAMP protein (TIGR02581 family)
MTALIPQPATFERLNIRHRIEADLVAVTALRVGAGKSLDAAATNQPVIRDALGRPYIPGSSLKGALRSGLESVLRGLDSKELWACELFEDGKQCVEDPKKVAKRTGSPLKVLELEAVLKDCCTACSLFGSPFLAGRVFFHDLRHLSGPATEVRDGVGIHRDLGTAQGGVKYDTEVVPAGSRFHLEVILENVDEDRLAVVLVALEMLHQGEILLGGLTGRGLGKVCLDRRKLHWTNARRLISGDGFQGEDFKTAVTKAQKRLGQVLEKEAQGHA